MSPSTFVGKKNMQEEEMISRGIGSRTTLQKGQLHKTPHQIPHSTLPTQASGTHVTHSAQDPPVS